MMSGEFEIEDEMNPRGAMPLIDLRPKTLAESDEEWLNDNDPYSGAECRRLGLDRVNAVMYDAGFSFSDMSELNQGIRKVLISLCETKINAMDYLTEADRKTLMTELYAKSNAELAAGLVEWQVNGIVLDQTFFGDARPGVGDNVSTGQKVAKVICSDCVLRSRCLETALSRREQYGIWGGLTPTERRRIIGGGGN